MADKYVLRVTAGPDYDLARHVEVPVNSPDPVRVTSPHIDVDLNVRVQNYRGLPRGAPATSPYFAHEPHASRDDQYSIALRFTLKDPSSSPPRQGQVDGGPDEEQDEQEGPKSAAAKGVSGHDLQFGNDLDHPIRDRLPPGFGTALRIVRWWIDPGLDGDPYADRPHLYGPALSSFNTVRAGAGTVDPQRGGLWVEEGASDDEDEGGDDDDEKRKGAAGRVQERSETGAPATDAKARMKWALRDESKDRWVWRFGRPYAVDFFNPYLDFSEFALRLPGFSMPVMKYWDGQGLRYVLRNRSTGQPYLVILFSLYLKEDVAEDGTINPEALEGTARASGGGPVGEGPDKTVTENLNGGAAGPAAEQTDGVTQDDDVD